MNFEFPYEPYDIQQQLMTNLYKSFENGYVSIVESPTGTGKSLSIICSLAKWLEDFKAKQLEQITKKIEELKIESKNLTNDNKSAKPVDDWLSDQLKHMTTNNEINDLNSKLEQLTKHINKAKLLKKKCQVKSLDNKKIIQKNPQANKRSIEEIGDDLLEDPEDLIIDFDEDSILDFDDEQKNDQEYFRPKIYYCSRTHSQLSQFIQEFKKTKYFKCYPTSLMMIPLSSRMNYCINPKVNHFNNLSMINERCNDLKQSSKKCPMYNRPKLEEFGQQILGQVCDLEEIVQMAKKEQTCPYYSSRVAIPDAEILVMPYNILLNKSTREYFGIQLKDSIVIVDEAHNLLETITNVHSIEIKSSQLASLLKFISMYMAKYNQRFNAQNLLYLKQMIFVTKKLLTFLSSAKENACYDPLELTLKLNIDTINIHKLLKFLEESRISSKLHMFSTKKQSNDKQQQNGKMQKTSKTLEFLNKFNPKKDQTETKSHSNNDPIQDDEFFTTNTLNSIKDFLQSLNYFDVEAKVLVTIDPNDRNNSSFKYLLLSTSSHFKDILRECRSVVLCGGTMKPFDDYIHQLFQPLNIPSERTTFHSYNHVISDDHLVALGLGRGPSNNIALNFSYANRNCPKVIEETGQLLVRLVESIPKGIVIFFPSYDYQEFILKRWEQSGILTQFEKQKKRIFREPKKSSLVQNILSSYSKFIQAQKENSAILFSVIGGKMSEGINFSDDLGRGVIVIGLPYANRNSVELIEKINYLNRINSNAGNEYYENLCMRAVNQAIGRAIRHRNDYAAIILIDERYQKKTVNQKLSDWIRSRFHFNLEPNQFDKTKSQIKEFFQTKG